MGKKKHGNTYDNDGFAVLIPRSTASVSSIHKRGSFDSDDEVEFWRKRCEDLREANEHLEDALKCAEETIATLHETIQIQDEYIESIEGCSGCSLPSLDEREPAYDMGVGLRIKPGEDPELYRLSDPHGKRGKQEFKGAEVELKPGHGLHIGLHFGRKEE